MDRVEQLSKIELFAGLKPQAFELIAKVATEESHALGTKIFQHGDAGDKLYVIVNPDAYQAWLQDIPGNLGKSEQNWPGIKFRAASEL